MKHNISFPILVVAFISFDQMFQTLAACSQFKREKKHFDMPVQALALYPLLLSLCHKEKGKANANCWKRQNILRNTVPRNENGKYAQAGAPTFGKIDLKICLFLFNFIKIFPS